MSTLDVLEDEVTASLVDIVREWLAEGDGDLGTLQYDLEAAMHSTLKFFAQFEPRGMASERVLEFIDLLNPLLEPLLAFAKKQHEAMA